MYSKLCLTLLLVLSLTACNRNITPNTDKYGTTYEDSTESNELIHPQIELEDTEQEPEEQPKETAKEQEKEPEESTEPNLEVDEEQLEVPPNTEEQNQLATDQDEVEPNSELPSFFPADELKRRWNAISEEYTLVNYIKSLEFIQNTEEAYYRAILDKGIEFRSYITDDKLINRFVLIGKKGNAEENSTLITSWWQLILLTNPEVTDIDLSFSNLGVGPNANLNQVKEQTFTIGEINYTVIPTDIGYNFEAVTQ
ncbi:hypothetical protein [Bacillus sp. PS06]|uniref:hypothetical protein n=1 Tax=Bacillus sp. PS06 TaxID=2764176 RepID=UPI0017852C09|nr:hypothetical protein [Bacillus sp. PS06]MBD8067462.1 hypothetical protein [Bacillus sp. PS06]